ncbi:MAG: NUDIX domain-containing protein, partial [Chitinivibrionales bacterium]
LYTRKRADYYRDCRLEFDERGRITTRIKHVRLLLMNTDGRIYLQKRSCGKGENPGLWDKSIEGHVPADSAFDTAMIRECAEELGFPAVILRDTEYERALNSMHLEIIGVLQPIDIGTFQISVRMTQDGSVLELPLMVATYVGYYNGHVKFVDGESSGLAVFSFDELKQELAVHGALYTNDLFTMAEEYGRWIKPLQIKSPLEGRIT